MIRSIEAWALRRAIVGHNLNGEAKLLGEPFLSLATHLSGLPAKGRTVALGGFLCGRPDRDVIQAAIEAADPEGPEPGDEGDADGAACATLADIRRVISNQPWLWEGWLAAAVLNAMASEPGTGKTRFALDLARRMYHKLPWPDGQENSLPAGSRTLWIQADRAFAQMLQVVQDFDIPDDAILLGASPEEPTGGLDLDDPEALAALSLRVRSSGVALVVVDTVGMTTARNLCRPEEARAFFGPLIDLAAECGVALLLLTHLSKGGEALGRRIVEKARVVLKMTQPDPEGQEHRRRLWVDKTAAMKPPALGITMGGPGNEYDFTPPTEPEDEPRRRGPEPEKLKDCCEWLKGRLGPVAVAVGELRDEADKAGISAKTLYRVRDTLGAVELTVGRRKFWKMEDVHDVQDSFD